MTPNPYFSIVVVNFRSVGALARLLGTVFSLEKERELFEVIIVNNDVREREVVSRLAQKYPVCIIESGVNAGFGQGANRGAFLARGKVIGFVNPDTQWQVAFLALLREYYEKQQLPVIVGIPLIDGIGVLEPWSQGSAPSLVRLLCDNVPFFPYRRVSRSLDWVSGGSLFLPKELFFRLDGFSHEYFLYFEDVDLCVRAKKLGASVQLVPCGALWHSGGQSFSSASQQKKVYYVSQMKYFRKHRPIMEYFLIRLMHRIIHRV